MKKTSTPRRTTRKTLLVLIALWSVPIFAWMALGYGAKVLAQFAHTVEEPRTVLVGERANDFRQGVDIVFQTLEPAKLRVESEGIVTSVSIEAGESLNSGFEALAVDGVPVISYTGESPFYRTLRVGDEGVDVEALYKLLQDTGQLSEDLDLSESYLYESWIADHVLEMQKSIGHSADAVIEPAEFLYVPINFNRVSRILVSVGDPVPGDKIIALSDPLATSFEVLRSGSEASPVSLSDQTITLSAGEQSYEIVQSSSIAPDINTLFETLLVWARAGVISLEEENATYTFRGLTSQRTDVTPVGVVPNTAVFVDSQGRTCLLVRNRSGAESLRGTTVSETTGEIGVVAVGPEFVGKTIVANIADSIEQDQTCP